MLDINNNESKKLMTFKIIFNLIILLTLVIGGWFTYKTVKTGIESNNITANRNKFDAITITLDDKYKMMDNLLEEAKNFAGYEYLSLQTKNEPEKNLEYSVEMKKSRMGIVANLDDDNIYSKEFMDNLDNKSKRKSIYDDKKNNQVLLPGNDGIVFMNSEIVEKYIKEERKIINIIIRDFGN